MSLLFRIPHQPHFLSRSAGLLRGVSDSRFLRSSIVNTLSVPSVWSLTKPTFWQTNRKVVSSFLYASLCDASVSIFGWSHWLIKRTFQPSILRKRRKTGLLRRQSTVGGRNILSRRRHKKRARLAGC
jgi:large subunit ribosomal protein L34